jgi:DNA recombination protein RmuC
MTGEFAISAALVIGALFIGGVIVLAMRRSSEMVARAAADSLADLKASCRQQLDDKDSQLVALRQELVDERGRLQTLQQQFGALHARYAAATAAAAEESRQNAQRLDELKAARQQMGDEFKALAGEVLKTHGETFAKQNREQVDTLLKPLGDKIVEFQQGMIKDRAELVEQVRNLAATSVAVGQEANNLARALKGGAQAQGAWGEMVLTSILEKSGLRRGEQFRVQESHQTEDGARLRTDVEVLLPNGDVVVIDSKVSLKAFDAFVNATDEAARADALSDHLASLRSHIRTLAGKDYHRHAGSGFDFVLMFVPIEGAFAAAVTAEPSLVDEALSSNVVLTTPTTLMSALRTIRNVWAIEARQRNAEEIAQRAGLLHDKVMGFLESMNRIDKTLGDARRAYDDAHAQLATGAGSVVRQIDMLRELGAKAKKPLPPGWQATELPDQAALAPERRRLTQPDGELFEAARGG